MSLKSTTQPCWRGKDDPTPFVAGLPLEIPEARNINQLFDSMVCCTRCELAVSRTQVVLGVGSATASLMFVGEAPGQKEDEAGRPFIGNAGRLLDKLLVEHKIARDDVFITNIVACRPPKNRTPRASEVRAHAPWIDAQLRLLQPQLIVTLGRIALTYFIPNAKVTQIRGEPQKIKHGELEFVLLPTFHPSAVLRDYEVMYPKIQSDFKKIAELLK
jgi:uracil-DNA glycosylase family 4